MTRPSDSPEGGLRGAVVALLRGAIEAVVLLLVCLSPWAFAGEVPFFEMIGFAAVALLLVLWAGRILAEGRFTWKKCPVALCLAALFLLGVGQITPLPRDLLRSLSPATGRAYDELLPPEGEILRGETAADPLTAAAGSTISLYPAASRRAVLRLLAVLCLFAVVRNNVATPGAFRRLAWAALVTGAALSFFGFVQLLTSAPGFVYWTYPSLGGVFGPFVYRNHFAFYINLCIGLGVGLLLSGRRRGGANLLQDPRAVWILLALALMVGALVCCLSRGGLLAAVLGGLVCLLVYRSRSSGWTSASAVLLVAGAVLALVAWFGHERLRARWAPMLTDQVLEEARFGVWARTLPVAEDFPLWGTGFGTFQHVELPRRESPGPAVVWDHAHNDYVEALIEGGVVRLALTLLATGLVGFLGYRAYARHRGGATGGLVLGALYAVATIAVHSFVDFGLHSPAIAVLAATLCAQLCALGGEGSRDRAGGNEYSLRLLGLAPVLGAAALVALALVLYGEGRRLNRTERCRTAALALADDPDPASRQRQIAYLEAALELAPDDASLQENLARAHVAEEGSADSHLAPALRHYLRARNACPLLSGPHVGIAANWKGLQKAEPASAYLRRATRLRPWDAEVWYLCGMQELAEGDRAAAWASCRRSLELSDRRLADILARCGRVLNPDDLLREVLPDRPALIVKAASQLFPGDTAGEGRAFLVQALALFAGPSPPQNAADIRLRAWLYRSLGKAEEAQASYHLALARDPEQVAWRYELAELLHQQGQLSEARQELLTILQEQPRHKDAARLFEVVSRELAEKR
jgi:O-antigen ligase/tetratricopeptide (TPR) repeat protein